MQPSDRQSPGEVDEQRREDTIEPASQPLYEFPGGEPSLYTAPPPASFAPPLPPPTPVKRSRAWIWIVGAFFSLALLAACGGCIWAFYAVLGPATQQISGATDVINDYYSNIKAQNYAAAYLDLSLNGQNPSSTGRSCSSYNTVLTLQKVAGRWKIVDFYKI